MKKRYLVIMTRLAVIALTVLTVAAVAAPALAESVQKEPAIDVTDIVTALLGLLATVITAYIVPWLKEKLGAEKYQNTLFITQVLVEAAEQIFAGPGRGQEKLDYVKKELNKRGITYDQSRIEAAVFNLRDVVFEDEVIYKDKNETEEDDEEKDEKPPEEGGKA